MPKFLVCMMLFICKYTINQKVLIMAKLKEGDCQELNFGIVQYQDIMVIIYC